MHVSMMIPPPAVADAAAEAKIEPREFAQLL
jgi:hypothetical protein